MFQRIFPQPPSDAELPVPPERNPFPLDSKMELDPGLGHAIPLHGQRLLDAGLLDAFTDFYKRQKGDGRTILLEGCAKNLANADRLEEWGQSARQNSVAQLFAGASYSHRAWEARGGRLANQVGGGQWQLFGTWLGVASEYLQRAIQLDPQDAESYHRMIRVLIGDSSLSDKGYLDYFRLVVARRPDHLLAHMEVLTQKCEKWGGSHKEMFDFAEKVTNGASNGSLLHTLTPMAILERMVYYTIDDDFEGGNAYLRTPEVRSRLLETYKRSVESSKLQDTPLTPVLYNWLAAAMIYSNVGDGRRVCLERMGDRITERPWAYISNPIVGLVNELRVDFKLPPL